MSNSCFALARCFSEERYKELVDVEHGPLREHALNKSSLAQDLSRTTGLPIVRQVLIRNIKGDLAALRSQYSFEFDHGIDGRPDIAIEVLRSGRYGSRDKIRYLMVKGRLLRYEIVDDRLRPHQRRLRLILVIDGNIWDLNTTLVDMFDHL